MAEITLTTENFEQEVINSEVPVLVDFWASWCGPCKMLMPVIDEIAGERTDIKVGKINADEEEELLTKYNVSSIPTLILFKDGKPLRQSVGAVPKSEVIKLIEG